jgi:hypothetical protein
MRMPIETSRLAIRTIQVTLESALSHAPASDRSKILARGLILYAHAREGATDPQLRAEIDRLTEDLEASLDREGAP